jgi:hypothetical protein
VTYPFEGEPDLLEDEVASLIGVLEFSLFEYTVAGLEKFILKTFTSRE